MSDSELTAKADVDLSAAQYHILRLTGDHTTNIASLNTDIGIAGVLQNKPTSGDHATLKYLGRGKIVAGAAITVNALLTSNGSGRAITQTGSLQYVVARALQAAGGNGEVIDCVYLPPFRL